MKDRMFRLVMKLRDLNERLGSTSESEKKAKIVLLSVADSERMLFCMYDVCEREK